MLNSNENKQFSRVLKCSAYTCFLKTYSRLVIQQLYNRKCIPSFGLLFSLLTINIL